MPALVAMAGHEGGGRDRLADPAVVDQFAAGLNPSAQKSVGRAPEEHPLGLGRRQRADAVFAGHGQRFFAINMLARLDGRQVDLRVGLGDGEVQDDLDGRVAQQFLDRAGPGDAELLGFGPGAAQVEIRAGGDLQDLEGFAVLKVIGADIAAADDADFDWGFQGGFSFSGML